VILPDGSYGTETIYVDDPSKMKLVDQQAQEASPLRKAIVNNDDDYLSSCLAVTLTKLVLKTKQQLKNYNQMAVDAMLVVCALLKAPKGKKSDPDSRQRMQLCLKLLMQPGKVKAGLLDKVLVEHGKQVFSRYLENSSLRQKKKALAKEEEQLLITPPEEQVVFRQLK